MHFKAKTIAEFIKGEIIGDPETIVSDVSKIEEGRPGTLAFLANPKYEKYIYNTEASVVIVNKDLKINDNVKPVLIKVENAYNSFTSLLEFVARMAPQKKGIEEPCFIDSTATVGENPYIGAFSYIGKNVTIGNNVKIYPQVYIGEGTKIGDNTVLYSGVKIYHECIVGSDCILHSGSVIGGDGFGFVQQDDQQYRKIPQLGNVIIEDMVELGSNVTIDRATMGSTIIRKGVKLDNLIQIGHNVEVGSNTVIVSQAGIAGSTKVGENCMLGGQAGLAGHLRIGNNVKIGAQSGVTNNLADGETVLGSPALNASRQVKAMIVYKSLPEMSKKLAELEKEISLLREKKV